MSNDMLLSDRLAKIAREALQRPAEKAHLFAQREIDKFTADELRELAVAEVVERIDRVRRASAQVAEREASRSREESAYQKDRAAWEQEKEAKEIERFELWHEKPELLIPGCTDSTDYPRQAERNRFLNWMGDRHGAWYARGVEIEDSEDRGFAPVFVAEYHPEGRDAFFAERRRLAVERLVEEVREDTRIEVTAELMETFFALGDGSRVSWGDATIDQHEQRLDMLKGNLSGLAETAGRHARAIEMLKESGAGSLRELAN